MKRRKVPFIYFVVVISCLNLARSQTRLEKLDRYATKCYDNASSCFLLLNRNERIGCAQCIPRSAEQPAAEFFTEAELTQFLQSDSSPRRVILLPISLFTQENVLNLLADHPQNVEAVIVDQNPNPSRPNIQFPKISSFSTELQIPNLNYTVQPPPGRDEVLYNPKGTNSSHRFYPFNIFQVPEEVAEEIRQRSARFGDIAKTESSFPRHVLQSMGTMFSCDKQNSGDCLRDGSCHPVGGLSIWSAVDSLDNRTTITDKGVLAITAPFDSSAFFKDLAYGASAEISSLAVLMAVVEAVGEYRRGHPNLPQLLFPAFFAFNGEAWGFSGSARFLKELRDSECSEPGPNGNICKDPDTPSLNLKGARFSVLSIDSVGNVSSDNPQFYIHRSPGGSNTLTEGLEEHVRPLVGISKSEGRDVVPLTAAQSFERYNKENLTEAISVADYENEFLNSFYHSQFDNVSRIGEEQYQAMTDLATGISRAVVAAAYEEGDSTVGSPDANAETIRQFIRCMAPSDGWESCQLARDYLGPQFEGGCNGRRLMASNAIKGSNYAQVFLPESVQWCERPSEMLKATLIRLFMAKHTGLSREGSNCKSDSDCNSFLQSLNEQVPRKAFCIASRCMAAHAYFHDAYGTGIRSTDKDKLEFSLDEGTSANRPVDAAWTESFFDNIQFCSFTQDSEGYSATILVVGILVFLASLAVSLSLNLVLLRESKIVDNTPVDANAETHEQNGQVENV